MTAEWEDGEPKNLEAAAENAYKWLQYIKIRANSIRMTPYDRQALDRCIDSLHSFLLSNAEVTGAPLAARPVD